MFIIFMFLLAIVIVINHSAKTYRYESYYAEHTTLYDLQVFLYNDETNKLKYDSENFNCVNFSWELMANGKNHGFNCGMAQIMYEGTYIGHQINYFIINGHIVFVEPQTDKIVNLKVGDEFDGQIIRQIELSEIKWRDWGGN